MSLKYVLEVSIGNNQQWPRWWLGTEQATSPLPAPNDDLGHQCIYIYIYICLNILTHTSQGKLTLILRVIFPNIYLQLISTHWGQVTRIGVGNLAIIGLDNGLLPGRRQAFI